MRLSIVIPAFNEEDTVAGVIGGIPESIPGIEDIRVIVMDDGSTDGTAAKASGAGALVYSLSQNRGLAAVISLGFKKCMENDSDIMVTLDADGQYDAGEIPRLVEPIVGDGADVVIGDRQVKKLDHMPRGKRIGNRIASRILSELVGSRILDGQTGFRAFGREAIRRIHIFSGYTYTQETLIQAKFKGLRIRQVPVSFGRRRDESRLISSVGTYAWRTATVLASTIIFYRSVRFFGILTAVLFGIGIGMSIFMINHYATTGIIRPFYAVLILGGLFVTAGMVSAIMMAVATISNRQSKLLEEILYHLRDGRDPAGTGREPAAGRAGGRRP